MSFAHNRAVYLPPVYDIIEHIFFRPPKDVPRKASSLYHIRLHRFGDRLPKDDHIHNLPLGDRPLMGVHILIEYMQFYYFVSVCVSWGGAGVNHVKRDWLEIFNVNCDLYLFFCVKRDWGYLRET